MNFLKFILLGGGSLLVYPPVSGFIKWIVLRPFTAISMRDTMLRTGAYSVSLPLLWILYFGYITRSFAGHASGFMFVVYLVVGFYFGYGPITTNGPSYSKADAVHAVVLIGWTGLLFWLIKTPGNVFGLIR
jgi:hypothetical protein